MTLDTTISPSRFGRLTRNQTAIDFHRHRRIGLVIAALVVVVTVLSLLFQGLNLGLDFRGGDAWEVPVTETFGVAEAQTVLEDNGVDTGGARIQIRSTETMQVVTVQTEVLPRETAAAITEAFAETAGVSRDEISFSFTSSTWGREITEAAARALVVFVVLVVVFLSIRLEWRMALAAIVAMLYDVVFAVGFYSLFQFRVAPATVIAFLTILGYSLYDTIVVFDRIRENEVRYASKTRPYADIVNIAMNQVLMRTLLTSLSSMLPMLSMLVIGAGLLGVTALQDFALVLLIGIISGMLSSIFLAAPLLAWLKRDTGRVSHRKPVTGDALRAEVMGVGAARLVADAETDDSPVEDTGGEPGDHEPVLVGSAVTQPADRLLTHPPRPRKKKRR
jgi:preprotein translocase subunit SecF